MFETTTQHRFSGEIPQSQVKNHMLQMTHVIMSPVLSRCVSGAVGAKCRAWHAAARIEFHKGIRESQIVR